MLVYLGADHAGFALKESVKDHLENHGIPFEDLGAHVLDPSDDYPEFAAAVAKAVVRNSQAVGVVMCGNAEGIAIAANKFDGIRAGIGYSIAAAQTMRNDDNANVLSLPGRVKISDDPLAILDAFLTTPFSGEERHVRRLEELAQLEAEN